MEFLQEHAKEFLGKSREERSTFWRDLSREEFQRRLKVMVEEIKRAEDAKVSRPEVVGQAPIYTITDEFPEAHDRGVQAVTQVPGQLWLPLPDGWRTPTTVATSPPKAGPLWFEEDLDEHGGYRAKRQSIDGRPMEWYEERW